MAIPTTLPITLDDVIVEIYGSSQVKSLLVDCFADANSSGFDASYVGSKDSLQNFRGYDHISLVEIDAYENDNSLTLCTESAWRGCKLYTPSGHSVSTCYANGESIYTDAAGTTLASTSHYKNYSSYSKPYTWYKWITNAWTTTGSCT